MIERDRYVGQRRSLIEKLRGKGIHDLEILRAFDLVPRHEFVPRSVAHSTR